MERSETQSNLKSPTKGQSALNSIRSAITKGFNVSKTIRQLSDNLEKKMSAGQQFYWTNDGCLKKVLKKKNASKRRKARVEIPPISWFYESGGVSPRRRPPPKEPELSHVRPSGPRGSIFQVYCDETHGNLVENSEDTDEYDEDERDTIDIECDTDDLLNIIEE